VAERSVDHLLIGGGLAAANCARWLREGGGEGKPMFLKVQLSYAATDEAARAGAHDPWRTNVFSNRVLTELRTVSEFDDLGAFEKALPDILGKPGPVFCALKVKPEVENEAIGNRVRWRKKSQVQVVSELKKELQIA
jgi:hypothetical protein